MSDGRAGAPHHRLIGVLKSPEIICGFEPDDDSLGRLDVLDRVSERRCRPHLFQSAGLEATSDLTAIE
ncbi:MAG: hypothetical protein AAF679_05190 [Pseudomonadota bacterium]